ncbi:4Fe-4S single cluster protein [Halanaerobium saccharolyticum]|uniref:4Fe-4S single cluster protein n=1 Tax=Halanaerobium saccharolyticum TaxID=43595 RepID=A0A4R6LPI3_9FIRM|nr:4Fe-4S single cluster protein [Halanaerobium saccharolyticum]
MKTSRSREEILFKTVKEDNILPITSICKLNCIFCSHKNNPPQVETYSFGHLDLDLIKTMIEFLDPEQPVFIGESASKIIEGEPFVHPDIYQILKYLRQRWPEIEIKITTSGSFLELNQIERLKSLNPLELNISLNAPAPEERVFLMNDSRPDNVFKVITRLREFNIDFEASIVSMHQLQGFEYLSRTFDFLENYSPKSLRVLMAGFSSYAAENLIIDQDEYYKLAQFITKIKGKYSYPIIIEPQQISSLQAEVNAVISNSPAAAAGLKERDIITQVNQEQVESRVDAFYKVKSAANPEIEFLRENKSMSTIISKGKKQSSGLIMSYDLSLEQKRKLKAYAEAGKKEQNDHLTVILCSQLAYVFLKEFLQSYLNSAQNLKLLQTENQFFGGSIMAAGLLTNLDLIKSLAEFDKKIERIILPEIIFDYYGNDLLGNHYSQLEEQFGAEVILI